MWMQVGTVRSCRTIGLFVRGYKTAVEGKGAQVAVLGDEGTLCVPPRYGSTV
ncbi:MAG TPA: hypothetical protein VIM51_13875 [Desulfosporosinus sp.]